MNTTTHLTEHGLETLIVSHLRDVHHYLEGTNDLYSKDVALVKPWLESYLNATQPEKVKRAMCFASPAETAKFYARLSGELAKRGVTDVLRKGFDHNGVTFDLYFPTPSPQNPTARALHAQNRFGVIRQLRYSTQNENALDIVIFVNGLPLATFELKNHYTKQTVQNAIKQYQLDRDAKETLLKPKRCAVHFAVDDTDVAMCTELKGAESWFLPFNRGVDGGAGNPVVPGKTMTSYLWEEVLSKASLANIIENFAQVIVEKDKKTGRTREKVIWPRYHQLDAVRRLLAETAACDVGRRFLVQHSAGSGKSNTLTWLAYQLVRLCGGTRSCASDLTATFDSIIVVTDRVNLDRQIRDNIQTFERLGNLVGWADDSEKLRALLTGGKKIIISTIHKFSFILDEIGTALKKRNFAIIIDEAHSSQSGEMAGNLSGVVSGCRGSDGEVFKRRKEVKEGDGEVFKRRKEEKEVKEGEEKSGEDSFDSFTSFVLLPTEEKILRILQGRKLAKNANYYAFTATPKSKTLEMFGERRAAADGVEFVPFHEYTMKQAIEEGFILDVLRNYTPYTSYYRVMKTVEDDPEFDKEKAPKRIRAYIEAQPATVEAKARIIVEHFCTKVFRKIGGRARAMVVTPSIERAIAYFQAISRLLAERGGRFKAVVAFTDKEIDGKLVTESALNGFASAQIEAKIVEEPYRILVVADKFQTGYDQPLLHTMYVDKTLSDLKAVQTLSRLNRAHPKKSDTFVLDFANDPEMIRAAFQRYYKTTTLAGESDINKLNNLIGEMERRPFYEAADRERVVTWSLTGKAADRAQIDAVLDGCVARFCGELSAAEQVAAKSAMKNYCRIYPYFAAIMPYEGTAWEKHYHFASLLVRKLPKLTREDFTAGLIETIDFEKYRIQEQEERHIQLEDVGARIDPVPVGSGGGVAEPQMDALSRIVEDFNRTFGGIEWTNADEARRQIGELPGRMQTNENFVNAVRSGDEYVAQIQFNEAITGIVAAMSEEKMEFVRHYFGNKAFQNFVNERVFRACWEGRTARADAPLEPVAEDYALAADSAKSESILAG